MFKVNKFHIMRELWYIFCGLIERDRAVHPKSGMMTITRTGAITVLAVLSTVLAQGTALSQISVTVSKKYAQRTRIAVPSFEQKAGTPDSNITSGIAGMLSSDLELSGYFSPLNKKKFVEETQADDVRTGKVHIAEWRRIGAEMVVKGTTRSSIEGVTVDCRVYSTATGQSVFGKRYTAPKGGLKKLAHKIADDIIYAVTGETGIASTQIAFVANRTGKKQIYVMDFDGSNVRRLSNDNSICLSPDWSPDGEKLVFTSYRRSYPEIYLQRAGGGAPKPVASFPGLNATGAVSPDGGSMLLSLSKDGNPEIYQLNLMTGGLRRLTRTRSAEIQPCWSPDGRRIAFVSDRTGLPQVYVMDLSTEKTRRLTYEGSYNVSPDWSPKDDKIVYSSRRGRDFDIYVIDANGGAADQVTSGSSSDDNPSWAPDGRHVVYESVNNYKSDLYMVDIYERLPVRLTNWDFDSSAPTWSPSL